MADRTLPTSRSLWARRELSFDLSEEFALDFQKALKTITPHFEAPKWMVGTGRKPQVVSSQKAGGGRCVEGSKPRERCEGSGRAHGAQGLQYL